MIGVCKTLKKRLIIVSRVSPVFEARKRHLDQECFLRNVQPAFNMSDLPLVFAPQRNFSFCMLSKTGSTTWAKYLASFLPVPEVLKQATANKHIWLRRTFAEGNNARRVTFLPIFSFPDAYRYPQNESDLRSVKATRSFLFVRHPFVRYVSSFRMLARRDRKRVT